jgi:acyl-CoA thioesterase-1
VAALLFLTVSFGCGREPKVANLDSPGTAIVALGDSITYGYGVPTEQTWPALLSDALGVEFINAGRSGDTTASGLQRLERDVLDLDPRLVIVELGGNDFLNKIPREQTIQNLDRIVAQCIDAGAMVILVHIQLGYFGDKYLDEFEAIADRHGALLVPDVMDGVFGRPSMMVDQIHPNAEGQRLIAARIGEAVVDVLERADSARENAKTGQV